MSQHDYNIADADGATVRADINDVLSAIVSRNAGSSAPSTTFAYMEWADTTNGVVKRRNAANSGWLVERTLDETLVVSRSTDTMLDTSDKGKILRATGSYTQTFDAVATLADGWFVGVKVESGVTLTLDPNSTETIDGASTLVITGPASGWIFCNGSALFTSGLQIAATQTQQEAGSSLVNYVTPGRQQYHPSAAKGWVKAAVDGTIFGTAYNVASVTDVGTGQARINWSTSFSSNHYVVVGSLFVDFSGALSGTLALTVRTSSFAAGSCYLNAVRLSDGADADPSGYFVAAFGDQ